VTTVATVRKVPDSTFAKPGHTGEIENAINGTRGVEKNRARDGDALPE
jgi:hypothetical protein